MKGTMSVHAVASDDRNLLVKATTCVCENCFRENGFNGDSACKWDNVTLKYAEPNNNVSKEMLKKFRYLII